MRGDTGTAMCTLPRVQRIESSDMRGRNQHRSAGTQNPLKLPQPIFCLTCQALRLKSATECLVTMHALFSCMPHASQQS